MGGLYGGIATVSETAALGAMAAFIMMVIVNGGKWIRQRKLLEALTETLNYRSHDLPGPHRFLCVQLLHHSVWRPRSSQSVGGRTACSPLAVVVCFLFFLLVSGLLLVSLFHFGDYPANHASGRCRYPRI